MSIILPNQAAMQKLINLIPLLISIVILNSCATILNTPTQKIKIIPDKKISNINIMNKGAYTNGDNIYIVPRSKNVLQINYYLDSVSKTYYQKPIRSNAFWLNLLLTTPGLLAMAVESNSNKTFEYPRTICMHLKDSTVYITKNAPTKKGDFRLGFSFFPIGGNMHINTTFGNQALFTIYPFEIGGDYFYSNNKYLSLNFGYSRGTISYGRNRYYRYNFFTESQVSEAKYISVLNNYSFNKFDIGFGLNYSSNDWRYIKSNTVYDTTTRMYNYYDTSKNAFINTLGACVNAQLKLSNTISIKAMYQANILALGQQASKGYQDLFTLSLAFKFPIQKK